jgi:transcriptional repressor NrdR
MKCPRCGKDSDRVLETRNSQAGSVIRRRRECGKCRFRFTTACRKRPISVEKLETIVNDIEDSLSDHYQTEVKSSDIGQMVLDGLFKLDEVSYVRFASVYKKFRNIDNFARELSNLKKERRWKKKRR